MLQYKHDENLKGPTKQSLGNTKRRAKLQLHTARQN